MDTTTNYLGLELRNPVIVGSCGLTSTVEGLLQAEEYGAGAVIVKSVFEEQIIYDIKRNTSFMAPTDNYGVSYEYIAQHVAEDSLEKHFSVIREAKKKMHIPIVGSINCYSFENWITYAKRFEEAGCDAMELNMAILPYETMMGCDDVDRLFSDIITSIKKFVSIPISVKVSNNFTNMAQFMQQLSWTSIGGITLFNKPLNIDIDIDNVKTVMAPKLSNPDDIYNTLRWVALLSKKVRCPLSASTGVFTADDVVKMLLAGASTVQVVSCLYKNGLSYLKELTSGLSDWMSKHGYNSVNEFRGMLAVGPSEESSLFFRSQFMKHFAEIQ